MRSTTASRAAVNLASLSGHCGQDAAAVDAEGQLLRGEGCGIWKSAEALLEWQPCRTYDFCFVLRCKGQAIFEGNAETTVELQSSDITCPAV